MKNKCMFHIFCLTLYVIVFFIKIFVKFITVFVRKNFILLCIVLVNINDMLIEQMETSTRIFDGHRLSKTPY